VERDVQAQLVPHARHGLRAAAGLAAGGHDLRHVARDEMEHQEDEERHADHDRRDGQDAPDDVAGHP
jgi:hypothetical protein